MDLVTVDHLLTTTRSVRKRLDLGRAVDPRIIQQCIEIAVQAPNGGNIGRYHFVVVTDPTKRARIAELYGKALALRARGLGSAWTTLHLMYEKDVAALLGIPADVTQAALLPVAYFTGDDFKPANRVPGRECTYWDAWGRTGLR